MENGKPGTNTKTYADKETIAGIIIDNLGYGVMVIDRDATIIYMNSEAERFFGLEHGKALGRGFVDMMEQVGYSPMDLLIHDTLSTGRVHRNIIKELDFGDRVKMAVFDTDRITDDRGNVTAAILVLKDITLQSWENHRMEQSEKMYLLGELAATIAHEIKNPMAVISGIMQLFRDKQDIDHNKIQQYAVLVLTEIERIDSLLKGYMITKIKCSNRAQVDIGSILEEYILFVRMSLNKPGVSIKLEIDDNLPQICVDVQQLKQVLLNLIQNSLNAVGEDGKISVRAFFKAKDRQLIIEVEDDGCGIPKDCVNNIFKPFYTTREGGTGLGLFLSRRLVAENDGDIWIDSREGLGTRVSIAFPVL
jgi:PAS domain S-box-containing protein